MVQSAFNGRRIVIFSGGAKTGDENLLNLAVVHTILNGGSVYALPENKMPEGAVVAALFRY